MNKRRHTKLVREGTYAAEVDVELIEADDGWSPYLSVDDAVQARRRSGSPPAWGHPSGIPTRAGVQPHARFAVSDRANKRMQRTRLGLMAELVGLSSARSSSCLSTSRP